MTATLHYEPINHQRVLPSNGAAGTVAENLKRVFGKFPILLDESDLDQLYTLARVFETDGNPGPYTALIDAVQQHDVIRVDVEY
jgi:hypothetical protein